MSVFSILMILHDFDLNEEGSQSVAIRSASNSFQRNINPAFWLGEF